MFDVNHIIEVGGILIVGLIIFAESGILLGIILPGDSLLIAAGVFAGRGRLPIDWLLITVIVAAIIGYEVGYIFGKRLGPSLFKRKNGFLFREEYLTRTESFFDKYGGVTVVLARFIAHVRTLVSLIAGASNMNKRKYHIYNVLGAVLWGGGLTMLGYWLGSRVPNVDKYIIPAVIATLAVLYGFTLWQLAKTPARRKALKKGLKEDYDYFVRGIRE